MWFIIVVIVLGCCALAAVGITPDVLFELCYKIFQLIYPCLSLCKECLSLCWEAFHFWCSAFGGAVMECCPTPGFMCLGIASGITCCWCFFLCEPDCSRKYRNKRENQLNNVQLTQPGLQNHLAQQQGPQNFSAAGEEQHEQQPQVAVAVPIQVESQLATAQWDNSAMNGVVKSDSEKI